MTPSSQAFPRAARALFIPLLVVATFVAGFGLGALTQPTSAQVNPNTRMPADAEEAFAPFWETYNLIEKTYLDPVERAALVDGAIRGMVESLDDPFSSYVEPEFNALDTDLSGSITGIGVVIELNEDLDQVTIVNILEGTPAEAAGLLEGDIFLEVDGEDVSGFNTDQLATRVRGQEGTTVNLKMLRGEKEVEFSIVRARINIPNIESEVLEGDIAYVKLNQFTSEARRQLNTAISDLQIENKRALIIDLRGNPGGLLSSAVQVTSMLVPGEDVVLYEQFGDGTEQVFNADGTALDINIPIVVLVDERSASASELAVGAWQDYDLVTVIGTTTFGKGVVQTQRDLINGGGLRLTIARWLSPNRTSIHELGITPDIVVEWSAEERRANPDADPQLQRAIDFLNNGE
ncbi:MAG: S41 family peptidase [Anaerolineae bacterium]|jgi:carboxyl-terminal processing protease|nr:S41 family peptidase [Anaerolineae bacterium]